MLVDRAHGVDRVGLGRGLVRTIALEPREPQRETARVVRALLKSVEGDLDDELGTHDHGMTAAVYEVTRFDVACPFCGYDLQGTITIAGARCSECGGRHGFDQIRFGRAGGLQNIFRDLCRSQTVVAARRRLVQITPWAQGFMTAITAVETLAGLRLGPKQRLAVAGAAALVLATASPRELLALAVVGFGGLVVAVARTPPFVSTAGESPRAR